MKLKCEVIGDLLPLYAEKICSEDTSRLVEEHIESCGRCRKALGEMTKGNLLPPDTNAAPFAKVKTKLLVRKVQTIVFSALLTLLIAVIGAAYLTAPNYFPYSSDLVAVSRQDSGTIVLSFSEEVSGYDINRYHDGDGYSYSITTWDTLWSQYFGKRSAQNTVLNSGAEQVVSVYYYTANGDEDILIYGRDLNPGGGVITLPRLALAYYQITALVLAVMCGVSWLVFRRNERARNVAEKGFLLPVSYMIGHLLVKGLGTSSYVMQRDFFAILLAMIPIYFILLFVAYIFKGKQEQGLRR